MKKKTPESNIQNVPLAKIRPNIKMDRQIIGLLCFIILIGIMMSFASSRFLSFNNLFNVLQQSAFIMILSLGMTFVLSTGGIDLSVGSVLAVSGGTTAWLLAHNSSLIVAIIAGLAVGTAFGIVNGLIITKLRIVPFIATLAMMGIARGILYVWTNAIPFRSYMKNDFDFLGQGKIFGVQFPIIIAVILFLIIVFIYRKTRFGQHILALGSNREAVSISGIKIDNLIIKTYALMGLIAAISGIVLASRMTTVHPEMGKGYELQAIAGVIIGGTRLSGGKGSMIGSMLGVIILFLIINAMNLLNINPYWENIVVGFIILIAVFVERFLRKRASGFQNN